MDPKLPEGCKKHQPDYRPKSWEEYTFVELGQWVDLLMTRAYHRRNAVKRAKDVYDARNYLAMMQAKLEAEGKELGLNMLDLNPNNEPSTEIECEGPPVASFAPNVDRLQLSTPLYAMTREGVYLMLDGEREYQKTLGEREHWPSCRTVGDYLAYLTRYLRRAVDTYSGSPMGQSVDQRTMDIIRKVTAIGVAAMEEHGCPPRKEA